MKSKSYELVSGTVFGVIATFQAIRAVLQVPAQVGAQVVPVWISWVAVVVAGSLCMWAFRTPSYRNIGSRERVVRVVGAGRAARRTANRDVRCAHERRLAIASCQVCERRTRRDRP